MHDVFPNGKNFHVENCVHVKCVSSLSELGGFARLQHGIPASPLNNFEAARKNAVFILLLSLLQLCKNNKSRSPCSARSVGSAYKGTRGQAEEQTAAFPAILELLKVSIGSTSGLQFSNLTVMFQVLFWGRKHYKRTIRLLLPPQRRLKKLRPHRLDDGELPWQLFAHFGSIPLLGGSKESSVNPGSHRRSLF